MYIISSISRWRDVLLTALAPVIWGSTYLVTTEFLPPDRPFTAALIRVLPAGVLLLLITRQLPVGRDWWRLLVLGALNIGFFQALLFVAAYRLPGGLAAVLGAVQPLMVMALAWGFDGRAPARVTGWAACAGVVGMAALLLSPQTTVEPVGMMAALFGALCMAAGVWLTKRWRPALPVLALTGWQLLIGGVMLAPVAWLVDAPARTVGRSMGCVCLPVRGRCHGRLCHLVSWRLSLAAGGSGIAGFAQPDHCCRPGQNPVQQAKR